MSSKKLAEYLTSNHVQYKMIPHSEAYTASETSQVAHVSPRNLAKTVIVRTPEKMIMVVVESDHQLDLKKLRKAIHESHLDIAKETEFTDEFPDCEMGAMPPFGNLYGMEVFVSDVLAKDDRIAFNAGSHTELFEISFEDFKKLTKPKIIQVTDKS